MHDLISANKRRTALLVSGFIVFLILVGWAAGLYIGSPVWGTVVALVFSALVSFGSYWKSDVIALRVSRAVPANPVTYQRLHNLVEGLCIASGLPKPAIYVIEDEAPNAFATGRNPRHAAIAVTSGLLDKMNRVELEGDLAHELSHIRNYDILISTMTVTLVGAIALLSDLAIRLMWWNGGRVRRSGDRGDSGNPLAIVGFVLLILAPVIAAILQAAVGRRRETLADVSACQMTRYPPGLISALEKLKADTTVT
ncbi:MAG: M48 family metallopeptidase, partial [Actinomycetota bacterium]